MLLQQVLRLPEIPHTPFPFPVRTRTSWCLSPNEVHVFSPLALNCNPIYLLSRPSRNRIHYRLPTSQKPSALLLLESSLSRSVSVAVWWCSRPQSHVFFTLKDGRQIYARAARGRAKAGCVVDSERGSRGVARAANCQYGTRVFVSMQRTGTYSQKDSWEGV